MLSHWSQSIEKRLTAIILAAMLVMALLVALSASYFIKKNNIKWQTIYTEKSAKLPLYLVQTQLKQLRDIVFSQAVWNETYNYINDANLDYQYQYLTTTGLKLLDIESILLQDADGYYLQGISSFSIEQQSELWANLLDVKSEVSSAQEDFGLIISQDILYLYASHPVTDTNMEHTANGSLTMLRQLSGQMLNEMANEMGQRFELIGASGNNSIARYSFTRGVTSSVLEVQQNPQASSLNITLGLTLADEQMLPIMFATSIAANTTWLTNPVLIFIVMIPVVTICAYFLFLLLRKQVISKIKKISNHIKAFDLKPGQLEAMTIHNMDELGVLASEVNNLYKRIAVKHDFSQLLLNSIGDIIITVNPLGQVEFTNPAAQAWLSISCEALKQQPLDYLITNMSNDSPCVASWVQKLTVEKQRINYHVQLRNICCIDTNYEAQVFGHPMNNGEQNNKGAVLIIRLQTSKTNQIN